MDLDSIITLLFLFFFFVLPGLLKRFMPKKKAAAPATAKPKKKRLVFGGLAQKIQQFIRQIEEQAKQQRQAQKAEESSWEEFMVDETDSREQDRWDEDDWDRDSDPKPSPEIKLPDSDVLQEAPASIPPHPAASQISGPYTQGPEIQAGKAWTAGSFRSSPLQNAVIWSEILGKPVGLRE